MSMNQEQSKRKFLIAALMCLSILVAVVVFGKLGERAPSLNLGVAASTVDGLLGHRDSDAFDGFASSLVGELGNELPDGFRDEVLDPGEREAFVGDSGDVVGIVYANPPEEAMLLVTRELQLRGWEKVESGNPQMVSFVKEEGTYRWVLLSVEGNQQETCMTFFYQIRKYEL